MSDNNGKTLIDLISDIGYTHPDTKWPWRYRFGYVRVMSAFASIYIVNLVLFRFGFDIEFNYMWCLVLWAVPFVGSIPFGIAMFVACVLGILLGIIPVDPQLAANMQLYGYQ